MSKLDQLKALGDARRAVRNNTPEASGTAREAPSGSLFGEPSQISDRASSQKPERSKAIVPAPIKRGRPRIGEKREKPWLTANPPMSERTWRRRQAEATNPVAKATKAKPSGLDAKGPSKTPVTPADRVVSRLGSGRTDQDSPRSETAGAVAIQRRARPRIGEQRAKPWIAAGMSKATWYRRQAEKAK
jgi:hypothetical protein